MKTEVKGLGLMLVDFMGALLPGMVWLIILITIPKVFVQNSTNKAVNPWQTAIQLLNKEPLKTKRTTDRMETKEGIPELGFLAFTLTGLLIGYAIKPNVMWLTECICHPNVWFKGKKRPIYLFPYNSKHRKNGYYFEIMRYLNQKYPKDLKKLSGHQPFTFCKRIIKSINPFLWQECEYREAELRYIGSLFLASLANLLLSLYYSFQCINHSLIWLIVSILTSLLLAYSFKRRREREVNYTYLLFHVAIRANVEGDYTKNEG